MKRNDLMNTNIDISAINAGNLIYSTVAQYMREGSLEDAEWMFEDNDLVWC